MEVILIESDDEGAAPPPSTKRQRVIDDVKCAAAGDDECQIVGVHPSELSDMAKSALLDRLLADNQALLRDKEAMAKRAAEASRAAVPTAQPRPTYWRRDGDGKRLEEAGGPAAVLVTLRPGSDEHESIVRRFLATGVQGGQQRDDVLRILRIHNSELWEAYSQRRSRMAQRAGGRADARSVNDLSVGVEGENESVLRPGSWQNAAVERYLFHGASPQTIDTIAESGVDFRLSNTNGALGACAYFADQSAYSHQYSSMADHSAEAHAHRQRQHAPTGTLKMLVCRVVLGSCGRGQGGLRRPPARPDGAMHDSVSNQPGEASNCASQGFMFGVFDNAQVYPEYMIEYRRPGGGAMHHSAGLPQLAQAQLAQAMAQARAAGMTAHANAATAALAQLVKISGQRSSRSKKKKR